MAKVEDDHGGNRHASIGGRGGQKWRPDRIVVIFGIDENGSAGTVGIFWRCQRNQGGIRFLCQ